MQIPLVIRNPGNESTVKTPTLNTKEYINDICISQGSTKPCKEKWKKKENGYGMNELKVFTLLHCKSKLICDCNQHPSFLLVISFYEKAGNLK